MGIFSVVPPVSASENEYQGFLLGQSWPMRMAEDLLPL